MKERENEREREEVEKNPLRINASNQTLVQERLSHGKREVYLATSQLIRHFKFLQFNPLHISHYEQFLKLFSSCFFLTTINFDLRKHQGKQTEA